MERRASCSRYLIEITAQVFEARDPETGKPLVDVILDEAQQKGTGKWMSQNAFDVGAPIPTVNAAVEARMMSALKTRARRRQQGPDGPVAPTFDGDRERLIEAARQALYASKITSYAQGMALLRMASTEYGYDIDPATVAKIWRAGCIIRAGLLERHPRRVRSRPVARQPAARRRVPRRDAPSARTAGARRADGGRAGHPGAGDWARRWPTTTAYRSARLPANLTQAQRDFFGAHTYRRVDRDGVFHTDWTGDGCHDWSIHTDDRRID